MAGTVGSVVGMAEGSAVAVGDGEVVGVPVGRFVGVAGRVGVDVGEGSGTTPGRCCSNRVTPPASTASGSRICMIFFVSGFIAVIVSNWGGR